MSKRTQIAGGIVHGGDRLTVELIHAVNGRPARIAIIWPGNPTICEPGQFPQAAADAARLLAAASTAVASLKAQRRLGERANFTQVAKELFPHPHGAIRLR